MRLLKDNDFKTFEQLCGCTQGSLKATMSKYLRNKYTNVVETKDYIYACGDIPIALVAHLDTVFKQPAREVYYDRQKNVIFSPYGLGADDRAGVFAIIQILKTGLRPHIIFTTDEEIGARGATQLGMIDCPFKDLRYIIQLDRRGANDCVFYDCYNEDFIVYVEDFGFVEAIGSFSDISMICPSWGIAGVNLSVGYRDEHSVSEVLFVGHLLSTIDKVIAMLSEKEIPTFNYIARNDYRNSWYRYLYSTETGIDDKHCRFCGKEFLPEELINFKSSLGITEYCCIDCISDKVDFCNCCGEAFEKYTLPNGKTNNLCLCEDCYYDEHYNY